MNKYIDEFINNINLSRLSESSYSPKTIYIKGKKFTFSSGVEPFEKSESKKLFIVEIEKNRFFYSIHYRRVILFDSTNYSFKTLTDKEIWNIGL